MRAITNFIVKARYFIIVLFICLAIISVFVSKNVKVNYDMAEYLPKDSETRIGMDIMEDEFGEINTSNLNVMFKNLSDEEKDKIYDELSKIDGVSSVDYKKDSEEYNKDENTLFVLNVDEKEDSKTAKKIYEEVNDKYEDYDFYTGGSIAKRNMPILPLWIIVLSVGICTVILLIMCESYIEPFLFLACIGIAVLLNKGSNIIFGTVSNITSSISAILQLALSMDYSIMLINRYKQEKEKTSDKVEAMKEALYKAFGSISSSSVTTIVGLVTLAFMSFTIGRDLGLVLAKGVLFSLLVIFTCLPALILMFDKLIVKTQKKTLNFKLDWLGRFAYKTRKFGFGLLIILFIVSYILKGNLEILYTASEIDVVGEVFPDNNQMVIVYDSKDEDKIAQYIKEIEENEKVDKVLGYGNTIGEKLKYDEFNDKLDELEVDAQIEDYLLKILYYKYYNEDTVNEMTFQEFVDFTRNKVLTNDNFKSKLSDTIESDLNRLEKFTSEGEINKGRSSSEIASLLEMNSDDCYNLFVYYNADKVQVSLTLGEFINFVNGVDTVSNDQKASLNTMSKFLNTEKINTYMGSSELASFMGLDVASVENVILYYYSILGVNEKMTLNEFSNFILNDVSKNPSYKNMFDTATLEKMNLLKTMSDAQVINKEMTSTELSYMFGIDIPVIDSLFIPNGIDKMTPYNFVGMILTNSESLLAGGVLLPENVAQLQTVYGIMSNSTNKFNYGEIAGFVGIDKNVTKQLYALYSFNKGKLTLSPYELVKFLLDHQGEDKIKGSLNGDTLSKLNLAYTVMNSAFNGTRYSASGMANFLSLNVDDVKLVYSLYYSKYINPNTLISLNTFINFIIDDVSVNPKYNSQFNSEKVEKLNTAKAIMNAGLAGTKFGPEDFFIIISKLTDTVDQNMVDVLYIYYGSENFYNDEWKISVEDFVNYINDNILGDSKFDDFISDDIRDKVKKSHKDIINAKDLLVGDKYSRILINTKFDLEGNETYSFLQKIYDDLDDIKFYLIGDSPMAYEMSKSFGDEFNKISILTMIAIFIVVAITFKSIIIPLILVLIIQCSVYVTMGVLTILGGSLYFIALLIVQSILLGATIDYAILYASYFKELRAEMDVKEAIIGSYNNSIHTILTSASILLLATFIVGAFTTAIISKICITLSQGVLCASIIIIFLLPGVLALFDKIIIRKKKIKNK